MTPLHIVILAAGVGKRMHSALPKVLHPLAGQPLLAHVLKTAQQLNPANIIVVYGHGGEQVRQHFQEAAITWVEQSQPLGTGHAVLQALPALGDSGRVLILAGDVPLISAATLIRLLEETAHNALGLLTAIVPEPTGLGRIVRNQQQAIIGIVEERDADTKQRTIQEIYAGILVAPVALLPQCLTQVTANNAQNEYYLTDIVALAIKAGYVIQNATAASAEEVQGINNRKQLVDLERFYQRQFAEKLLHSGVTITDPARFDARGEVIAAQDVTIDIDVILEGKVVLGEGCQIGPHVILRNVTLGKHVIVQAHSIVDGAVIGDHASIGPFARIRPGTQLAEHVHIGNFVELKKAQLGQGSKANHLTYLGDVTIGQHVNVGAGVITCNYDGVNKHHTHIGNEVFVGSNSALIAPLQIDDEVTIGAGSVITKSVPAKALALTRATQQTIPNWPRPQKKSHEVNDNA